MGQITSQVKQLRVNIFLRVNGVFRLQSEFKNFKSKLQQQNILFSKVANIKKEKWGGYKRRWSIPVYLINTKLDERDIGGFKAALTLRENMVKPQTGSHVIISPFLLNF